ncbi:MAG: hypothetical protein ABFD50_08180 [Smithella sp.]
MPAPSFRSSGTVVRTTADNTSITPVAPAGATDGDILILFAAARADDIATNLPFIFANGTGWTEITSGYTDIGTTSMQARAWWYRVSGSVPTMPSVRHASLSSNGMGAIVCAYSGCIASGTPVEAASARAADGTIQGVAVTTTDIDRLVVMNYFWDDSGTTGTTPSGWTNNSLKTSSTDVVIRNDSISRATAGTQAAPSLGASERHSALGFALLPIVSPAGNPGSFFAFF